MKLWNLAALGLTLCSGMALAQTDNTQTENTNPSPEIRELRRALDAATTRLSALEEKQTEAKKPEAKAESKSDPVRIYGDFRYRHEGLDADTTSTQHRHRIRARIGAEARLQDDLLLNIRLNTGESNSPISPNQTLDGGFTKKDIYLDLAYFQWTCPENKMNLFGGKVPNPFYRVADNQILFDQDLNPEGGAVKWSDDFGGWKLFGNGGAFWVEERSSEADSGLFGAQFGLEMDVDNNKAKLGAGYYNFSNLRDNSSISGNFGNNSNAGGIYSKEYRPFEIFGEMAFAGDCCPWSLFATYIKNTATAHADHAWTAGVGLGKLKEAGDWSAKYAYRVVEADAVLGAFTDSDATGGGTDARGHEVSFGYQIGKKWVGMLTAYQMEKTLGATTDFTRVQLDLIFKF